MPDQEGQSFSRNKLIYESGNGDAWFLDLDPATGLPAVKHVANLQSGGHVSYIPLENFLAAGNGPEHQALRKLVEAESLATILIAHDMHPAQGPAYQKLEEAICALGAWWHHLETVWIVRSNKSPDIIRAELRALIGTDDQLLVVDITGDQAAWVGINQAGDTWLRQNIEWREPSQTGV
jgi:hypothetical protein